MNLVIDLTPIFNFFRLPPDQLIRAILINYGWLPIGIIFVWGALQVWLYYRQSLYKNTLKFVLLAIDIPRANDLSPKAVENLFSYLGGGHEPPDLIEKWWQGMFQLGWSFEIVSIEGYIQFLVYTPTKLKEILETAVYSQYPDAEITEVNDYTEGIPIKYPNDEYNVWGAEFIPTKNNAYPIRTFKDFEHMASAPETQFKDPMAVLMDMLASLKKGEQFWYQIIVYPTDLKWAKIGDAEISKILKEKPKAKKNIADVTISAFIDLLWGIAEFILPTGITGSEEKKEEDTLKMINLKPKEKKQVEAIQTKISKQGFECKIRFVYVAKKEAMNKGKAIYGIIGFIKQFLDLDLNSFKPDMDVTATSAHYFFIESRKNLKKGKIVSAYRDRTGTRGRTRFILNTEELATLWHFPVEAVVKVPLIQKAPGRKGGAPMTLPTAEESVSDDLEAFVKSGQIDQIFLEPVRLQKKPEAAGEKKPSESESAAFAEDTKSAAGDNEEKSAGAGEPPANLPFV